VEDAALVEQWFELSEVELSWGSPESNLRFLHRPTAGAGHRTILVENEPVGYVRWQRSSIEPYRGMTLFDVLGNNAVRIDVLVGPRERRFVGLGSVALRRVREELSSECSGRSFWGLTSIHHLAARRAYEKAGFRHHYFFDHAQLGPSVAMVRPAK
jgi:hypothetical protein